MKHNICVKPPRYMGRLCIIVFVLTFAGCTTAGKSGPETSIEQGAGKGVQTGNIVFLNKTPFTVHLKRGSGRADVASIIAGSSVTVPNIYDSAELYYPLFDVPLTSSYSITLRPDDINFYYQIDNNKARQEIEIGLPLRFNDSGVYIHFANNSKAGGISLSLNEETGYLTGVNFPDGKYNINQGEAMVYREEKPERLQYLRINPGKTKFGELKYKPSYAYYFSYDGSAVTLTDFRPLHRVGEPSWPKTPKTVETIAPMPLVTADNEIHLFASTGKTVMRYAYDSAGNLKAQVENGDGFTVNAAAQTGGGFFIAGQIIVNGNTQAVARIHNTDGTTKHVFEPSTNYPTARLFAIAQQHDNDAWLLTGDGAKIGSFLNTAYASLIQNKGGVFSTIWELGGDDCTDSVSGVTCRDIQSAAYDQTRNCWLITGEAIKNKVVSGAYVAQIDTNGKFKMLNASFTGMSFCKILAGNGMCFLAGEEYKGNETYAVLIKYNVNNGQSQQISAQVPAHSYYHDAVFDHANNRIALAGTMQAHDEYGHGGSPFIEAADIESGALLWRETLSSPAVQGTSLVTAIVPAPDYGFALAVSNINANGDYQEPFMIARINSQGKY